MRRCAEISECGQHRLLLGRTWADGPVVLFVGLNPSTADALVDDPTLRRCIGFARSWSYGGVLVANLYTLRAADPRALVATRHRLAPGADDALQRAAAQAALIIEAWGAHPLAAERSPRAQALLASTAAGQGGGEPAPRAVLGRTKSGAPRHPLYVRGDARPQIITPGPRPGTAASPLFAPAPSGARPRTA